ncbi:AraC family transcriptional regulator [Caldicellulosiruptor naganoensis]|nr:AraC family transcriptional regulator [Caldicellulosiruptor naganoensis]WAM32754.1 AraC family transcriptional regulator [Caldicellulosiruptor naganoensis]
MVGFSDEKYFSQVFKKYTGLTPSQFRESLL